MLKYVRNNFRTIFDTAIKIPALLFTIKELLEQLRLQNNSAYKYNYFFTQNKSKIGLAVTKILSNRQNDTHPVPLILRYVIFFIL